MEHLRLALRTLSRTPGFSAAAVLVLALGVGGSTAVFSVLRGVVLRPLAVPHGEELVRIYERPAGMDARWPQSGPDYLDIASESRAFESVAGMHAVRQTLTGRGPPVQVRSARVTASFFATFRVWPAIGGAITAEGDQAGGARTAVLTDGFWRREFGGERSAVGATLTLDGRTYTIAGVMPPEFRLPLLKGAEVLVSAALEPIERERRDIMWISTVARLKAGVGLREAQADLDVLSPRLAARIAEHDGWRQEAVPLLDDLVGALEPALNALFLAVLLALLIACLNVASLLLARGMARQRELAVRAALGGGRWHLIRQLLAEAMVLAVAGGGLALLAAPWGLSALLALAPPEMPRLDEVRIDGTVMVFALAASMGAGLLAGLAPALQLTRPRLMDVLREGSGGTMGRGRARSVLVIAEIALAFMLAAGAGLMIRTLSGLLDVPTGLAAPERVLVADLDLPSSRYAGARIGAFAQDLLSRVSAAPGVRSAALATSVPLDPRGAHEFGFELEGGEPFPPGQPPKAEIVFATPGYLEALGVPLIRGRDLRWGDAQDAPRVALVNQAFVRRFLPGEPLGRRIARLVGPDDWAWQISGVIGDVRTRGLEREPMPLIVVPLLQFPIAQLRLAVRVAAGDPLGIVLPLRSELSSLDKDIPLAAPQSLARVVSESVGERRFQATLLSIFAFLALALAAIGIYGVMAWTVAQRSREIGIRMALGADSRLVQRMVVAGGLRLAAAGVGFGLAGALAGTRFLKTLVYQVSTVDPLTLAFAAAVLIGAALVASWLPARRATRVDPAVTLRAE